MSILHMSLSVPSTPQTLSSSKAFSGGLISLPLTTKLPRLSLNTTTPYKMTPIRMGGGPRTFPGGVSKWQWKRMQAKKSKQLLKARLVRERQIYEMRKRAELKAAVSELERPWEIVEKPPNLFSVGSDEQLKVLADRFQKPGGFDMWSERDGPELFRPDDSGLPSSRFFPKGVVHSIKPYVKIANADGRFKELKGSNSRSDLISGDGGETGTRRNSRPDSISGETGTRRKSRPDSISGGGGETGTRRKGYIGSSKSKSGNLGLNKGRNGSDFEAIDSNDVMKEGGSGNSVNSRLRKMGHRRNYKSEQEEMKFGSIGLRNSAGKVGRSRGFENGGNNNLEVFDMSLRNDGSYGFELENK